MNRAEQQQYQQQAFGDIQDRKHYGKNSMTDSFFYCSVRFVTAEEFLSCRVARFPMQLVHQLRPSPNCNSYVHRNLQRIAGRRQWRSGVLGVGYHIQATTMHWLSPVADRLVRSLVGSNIERQSNLLLSNHIHMQSTAAVPSMLCPVLFRSD